MTGDFSRLLRDRRKHYSGVQMQQGRVQLDADWNAQADLAAQRVETATADVVGENGGPHGAAGFGISTRLALRFDGQDDYVYTPRPPAPGAAYTLTAWASPRPGSAGGTVVGRYAEAEGQRDACILAVDARGVVSFRRGGQDPVELRSERPIPFGRASHLAVAGGAAETVLYVDGAAAASRAQGFPLPQLPAALFIGAALLDRHLHLCFAGLLYDVCWWGAALDAGRIRDLRRHGPAGNEEDLLAWWPLDEPDGEQAGDRTGRGHDASLGAGASRPARAVREISVGAGRYYVGGTLCENAAPVPYTGQPDLPGAALPQEGGLQLAYLDVWERFVTAIEDPDLREVALGGPTTTTRTRTIAQVRLRPAGDDRDAALAADWDAELAAGTPRGRLRANRQLPPRTTLGNQLYRVEIHTAGAAPSPPTFKWSRNNGALAYAVGGVDGSSVKLQPGDGGRIEVPPGSWVELVDDSTVLAGASGPLLQVATVQPDASAVVLAAAPPAGMGNDPALHPLLRLWDQRELPGSPLAGGAVPAPAGAWIDLEAGIQVWFEGDGPYRAGDYWWMPARTLTEDIEWPRDDDGRPLAEPPAGVEHRAAPLALLDLASGAVWDRRRTFQPLVDGAVSKAGDTMYGSLAIHAGLAVEREIRGDVYYGRLGSAYVVGTDQIVDRAVTAAKLAPEIGTVPPGYSILGDSEEPPPGYVWTRASLAFANAEPRWRPAGALPREHAGAIAAVAAAGRIYALLEIGEVWELDPADGAIALAARLPEARRGFAAAALDGRIYALGGVDPSGAKSPRVDEYDPAAGRWTRRADLPTARDGLAAAALDGRLHAVGGRGAGRWGEAPLAVHETYDPAGDSWSARRPLPTARYGLAAAALGGRLHAAGGERRVFWLGRTITGLHEAYQPSTDVWERRAPLLFPRRGMALAELAGKLYGLGGEGPLGGGNSNQVYEPAGGSWYEGLSLPLAVAAPGAAASAGRLYLFGGRKGSAAAVPIHDLAIHAILYVHRKLAPGEAAPADETAPPGLPTGG